MFLRWREMNFQKDKEFLWMFKFVEGNVHYIRKGCGGGSDPLLIVF